jgi:hypothetical protein
MLARWVRHYSATAASLVLLLILATELQAQDFTYTNTNGSITITGYTGPGGNVAIPSTIAGRPVTGIGDYAFQFNRSLTNLSIPVSVTNVGSYAFVGCNSLTNFVIPNSVTTLEEGTLDACTNLESVTIGSSVTSIGLLAFNNCTHLTSATIPDKVTNIQDGAGAMGAGNFGAFSYCTSLTNVVVGISVTNIGDYAFLGCTSLLSVYCGGNAPRQGAGVFDNADNVTVYYLPGTTGWGATFGGRPTALWKQAGDFTFTNANGAITITGYAGSGGNVTIPGIIAGRPVTSIGGFAFNNQSSVTRVTIPDGVTSIESGLAPLGGAFGFCGSLTNVTIGNNLTNIGDYAFVFCTHLLGIYARGNSPSFGAQVFQNDNATVYYLPGTKGWSATFGGLPTALWNPQAQTSDASFGVRQNRFGFNITGTANIPLVVEASASLAGRSWVALQSYTLTNGLLYFSDPQWTNYPSRVYRIRSP